MSVYNAFNYPIWARSIQSMVYADCWQFNVALLSPWCDAYAAFNVCEKQLLLEALRSEDECRSLQGRANFLLQRLGTRAPELLQAFLAILDSSDTDSCTSCQSNWEGVAGASHPNDLPSASGRRRRGCQQTMIILLHPSPTIAAPGPRQRDGVCGDKH